jgi:hypothetical protein
MAQHDLNIANQSFPSFRSDLNNALSAIQTTHSGTSRPTGAVAGQIWLDTTSATSPTLKYYDGADDISLATIDHSANTVNWLDSTVSITGLTTTATGTVLTLTDTHLNSTVSIRIPTTKGIDDDSGNEFLKFTKTASAVNEFTIINSATGSAPEIQSTGGDTNIDLKITPKGTGKIILDGLAFPNADGSANQVLQTNGSGVLSFATPSSVANTPAFLAYLSADQSISNGVQVKAQFNTEVFDVGGCYDNATNYRFTPNVAGKYMVFSNLLIQLNDYGVYNASIEPFLNGSQYTFGNNVFGSGTNLSICMYVSHIISFNGTTDYVEIFGSMERHTSSGNRFDSGIKSSYFGAYRIIE